MVQFLPQARIGVDTRNLSLPGLSGLGDAVGQIGVNREASRKEGVRSNALAESARILKSGGSIADSTIPLIESGDNELAMVGQRALIQARNQVSKQPDLTFEQKMQLRRAGKPETTVNIAGEKKEQQKLGEGRAELFLEGQKESSLASSNLIELEQIESAANDPNLFTGTGGASVQAVKKGLKTLFNTEVEGVTSGEIIEKSNKRLIQEAIKVQGRGFSDADLKFAQSAQPGLADSKEGLIVAVGMAKRAERFKIQKQQIREQFLEDNKTLKGVNKQLRPFESEYIKQTKADLSRLRAIAKKAKQPSPFIGMNLNDLGKINPKNLSPAQLEQARERFEELNSGR